MSEVENICRACLGKSKSLLIFQEKVTKFEKVFQCFQNLTSIMIKPEEFDSRICRKCFQKLKQACEFKEQCLENDDKYRELIKGSLQNQTSSNFNSFQFITVKQEEESSSEDNNDNSQLDSYVDVEIKEEVADNSVVSELKPKTKTKVRKRKTPNNDNEEMVRCTFCGKNYTKKNIKRHEFRTHLAQYYCDHCPVSYKRKEQLLPHLLGHTNLGAREECTYCHKKFITTGQLRQHVRQVHAFGHKVKPKKPEGGFKANTTCLICNITFKDYKKRYQHDLTHHRPKPEFICDVCGVIKRKKCDLRIHMKTHLGIRDQICDICGKGFFSRPKMLIHRRTVHDTEEKKYQCPFCDKSYILKNYLNTHLKFHSNKREHQCYICGKFLRSHNSLEDHIKGHGDTFDYECKLCGKRFQRKKNMEIHMKLHERDAAGIVYQCSICSVALKSAISLRNHTKLHTGQREYQCSQCAKNFTEKYQLNRHILSSHVHAEFGCKLCGFRFRVGRSFKQMYTKHVKEYHLELSPAELLAFEKEIRKLKYTEVVDGLPAEIQRGPASTECSICFIKFASVKKLENHMTVFHTN